MAKEEIIQETSKQLVQSYILTTARRDWGIYAERFLLRLVELAQTDISGMDFKHGKDLRPHSPSLAYPNVTKNEAGDAVVTIPVKELLPSEGYTNYQYIQDAIEQLQTKVLRWEETKLDSNGNIVKDKNGKPIHKWTSVQLIGRAEGEDDLAGSIQVRIDATIWKAMVDFTKGFRAFDLNVALKLKSKYSLRIYQLLSRQEYPITYTIDDLKEQWGITDSYKRPDDFINRAIIPAKNELDQVSPYSFEYKVERSDKPGRGKKPIEKITFFPIHQVQYESRTALKGEFDAVSMMLKPEVRAILMEKYNFAHYEINTNFELIYEAQKRMTGTDEEHPTLARFLVNLSLGAAKAKNPKAYIIASIKKHMLERYNFVYRTKKEKLAAEKAIKDALKRSPGRKKDEFTSLGDLFSGKNS